MKKTLILFLALGLFSFSLKGQSLSVTDKSAMASRLAEFVDLSKIEDYSRILDYSYPKLFDFVLKKDMLDVFNSIESMGIDMIFEEMNLKEPSLIEDTGEIKYVLCPYNAKISIVLISAEMRKNKNSKAMVQAFEQQFGKKNTSYDASLHKISTQGLKQILAIQDNKYGNEWFFMEFDTSNPQLLDLLLPVNVVEKIMAKIK
ncbi:MAG: hypothetical protein ACJAXB_000944 [Candidatus Endobugula sp.]|jgi:hypothetical protein